MCTVTNTHDLWIVHASCRLNGTHVMQSACSVTNAGLFVNGTHVTQSACSVTNAGLFVNGAHVMQSACSVTNAGFYYLCDSTGLNRDVCV